jgi:hypothetical protein
LIRRTLIALALSLCLPCAAGAQKLRALSTADRANLRRAEALADSFVERFRRTLDFGTVWEEFRREDPRCAYETNGLFTPDSYDFKLDESLLRRHYVSSMNFYYLKMANDLSTLRIDGNAEVVSEKHYTPKRVLTAKRRAKWIRLDDYDGNDDQRKPQSVAELDEMLSEVDDIARLYRKQMPRDAMRSRAWRANNRYLTHRSGYVHAGVDDGSPCLCVPERTKVYIVDRGIFYFYIIEERGRMRVAGLGID